MSPHCTMIDTTFKEMNKTILFGFTEIRRKLKSRTGHWSVRDFNFLRILRFGKLLSA